MKLQPVTILADPEPLRLRLYLEEVRKEVFPNGSNGFNEDRFSGKDIKANHIADLANTLPMMSDRRLISVFGLGKIKESEQEAWLRYFENPAPHTVLVLTTAKLDSRTKFAKKIKSLGFLLELSAPRAQDLPRWIEKLSKTRDLEMEPSAVTALAEAIGPNLSRLDQEIEKLAIYEHPRKKIRRETVEELVLQTSGENVFAWTDQVLDGKAAKSLKTLEHLLRTGNVPLVLISLMARHLRILLKAKDLPGAGSSAAKVLGVPPFVVSKYLSQARTRSKRDLVEAFEQVQTLERSLKSSGLAARPLLERLSLKLGSNRQMP